MRVGLAQLHLPPLDVVHNVEATVAAIEAAADGWWYASPLPDQRRVIALFTDAREVVRSRLATVGGWTDALARTEHVGDLASGVPCGRIRVTSSASHELDPPVGDNWIAVGDAAFAADPL